MGTTALIALITALVPVANDLIAWIFKTQATLKQDVELTTEQEAELDAAIAKLKTNPEEYQKEQPI
jgi:hypothetical protein